MNQTLLHRGPDNSGVWLDRNSGTVLGHQRLAIIDLSSAGNQPMQSKSGRYIITYNGEIYNHLEVRRELERSDSGIKWQGNSDTETLLESIEYWGVEKVLNKIDGMFAFGIWDQKNRSLILARDRLGEKPLYYGWQGKGNNKTFLFSSELKALKVHPEFHGEINREAIALQLRHNCIPAPYSIYKNIYKLLPGNYLKLTYNDLKKGFLPHSIIYWSLKECAIYGNNNKLFHNEEEIKNNLENQLQQSVKKQLISDVPIGAFLSGGIDSSTIVALMQSQLNYPIKTFTIGFSEDAYSEAEYAKKIANHLNTDHTELYVSPKMALDVIPKLSTIYDEPFSDSSQIPMFLVSQLAKQHVKVSLSGDGGDELFCGYNRYTISKKFWQILRLMPLALRKFLKSRIHSISPKNWYKIAHLLPGSGQYTSFGDKMHKGANTLEADTALDLYYILCSHWQNPSEVVINSQEPGTLLTNLRPELTNLSDQQKMMVLDLLTYLPDDILVKVDRSAMASSLETRAPFLDHKLIELAWKIPQSLKIKNGSGKWILRQILNKYVPNNLTERPKMGFAVPLDSWLRGPLRDWAEDLLDEKRLHYEGYLNSKIIRQKWLEHLSGHRNWQSDLWDVLMFQAWLKENH
tara:strand:- start:8556 stop:10448 length:1893 start_codon:yes stop_codon:yes gene_type:complete